MKAAWDWHLPRSSETDRTRLVDFVADLGFDVLVLNRPTPDIVSRARTRGIRTVSVLSPITDASFAEHHPEALQRMLPYEDRMLEVISTDRTEQAQRVAHRWFPILQSGQLLCYEHEASREILKRSISDCLKLCDGVALDGFGFANHYACFCDSCREYHKSDPLKIAEYSEASLVEISRILYEHVKNVRNDAILMNHIWPPFNPNPYYGCNLYLDYCTQTISWFYKPSWTLNRVQFEAQRQQSLERPERNTFVPFIGLNADPYLIRSPERLRDELEIAREFGNGSFVLCTLEAPSRDEEIRSIVRSACNE